MKFEEMKKIWDTQANETVYAINEDSLHKGVIAKSIRVKRYTNYTEFYFLGLMLFLAIMGIVDGIINHQYYQLPEGALLLIAAGNIYHQRLKRLKIMGTSNNSLLGDLKQTIKTMDYSIERGKKFVWWFVAPILASQVIHFAYTYQGKPWWLWVLMVVAFTAATILIKISVKKGSLPQKREFEALQKLLETEV